MTRDIEPVSAGVAEGTVMRNGEHLCKCCGDPKPRAQFRVVGPPGERRRLSTCKSCQRRLGLGAACRPSRL